MSTVKLCRKCNIEKSIEYFSKHSGTKDKLDNRCKECVKLVKKKSKESDNILEYEVYDFDHDSKEWQVGKVSGTILERENKKYECRIKIDGKNKSKSFAFDKYDSKENAYKEAKKWLRKTSDENKLTRNKIRKLDDKIIEITITQNEIMKTDIKFVDLCQKYTIVAIKGGNKDVENCAGLSINNKIIRFHNYITGFDIVDHINRDPLDNRLENLRDTNHKLNNNNRDGLKKNKEEEDHNVGVKFDSRYGSFVARIKQDGKEYSKSFNIKKFGEEEAKRLAIEYRKELCERFESKNGL